MSFFLIFLCSYIAFSLSALCGGGAGLILMPILGRLLPVNQIPVALSIGTFTSSFSRLIVFFKNINWHIVRYFLPTALPAVALGALLLKYVNPVYLEVVMSLFLISHLPLVLKKNKQINTVHRGSDRKLLVIGFFAGFLSGFTGAVGLLFNKFYLQYGLSKEEIVATRAANEIILHLIKIVLYICFGLITSDAINIGVLVAISALLSTWTMKWILPRIKDGFFKRIGYGAMVFSGFVMLGQSGTSALRLNNADLSSRPISNGIEARLQWQKSGYTLEFTYDEGFEFEQVIPLTELSKSQQNLVLQQGTNSDKVIIEAVYNIGSASYEAYYFKSNKLVRKIDFNRDSIITTSEFR